LPISPARTTAYRILRRVQAGRGFAVDLLQTPEVSALGEADRRLATEIVMGVLRWRGELDFQIGQCSGRPVERLDPEVATILRLGVYQIQFLERVPKAAAVNEAVEMTKAAHKQSAAGFVNAVLRKCPPGEGAIRLQRFDDLERTTLESVRRATPAWLLDRWASNFSRPGVDGGNVALRLAWASTQVPPTVLRVVHPAQDVPRLREELKEEGITTRLGSFLGGALVVESGNVQRTQALLEGRVVIQDEASQLVAELLVPRAEQRVLDLCAAPGIKAGQIAQALGSGTLIACDLSAARLGTMARLLPQWLPKGVRLQTIRLDATEALPFRCRFERILLDAPCSGTGTLARNPEIKWRLRPEDLKGLAEAQCRMLKNALGSLCLGGRLVYATCSLEPEENEGVVERVLEESPGYQVVSPAELQSAHPALGPLFEPRGYLRTRPDLHSMDGFFAAVIVRND
jgi:16S rRNA (cytosine967-C5)-methyltransferase